MNGKRTLFLLPILMYFSVSIRAHDFIYPIAVSYADDQPIMYLMHQAGPQQIELIGWNVVTQEIFPLLHSLFTPAMVRLLPDGTGFSFVDNGRIRIKKFNKRSPKTLDIYDPLFKISAFEWINEHSSYISAKKRNRYGIFQLDDEGNVSTIAYSRTCDCLYPQKVGSLLYYIERSETALDLVRYEIVCTLFPDSNSCTPSFNDLDNFTDRARHLFESYEHEDEPDRAVGNDSSLVLSFGNRPIMHLKMLSPTQGFVIEYPETVDSDDETIPFTLNLFTLRFDGWHNKPLFTFNLPRCLIGQASDERLFESIAPLIPTVINQRLYFVTAPSNGGALSICCYDLQTDTLDQCTQCMANSYLFAPISLQNRIYYGGSLSELCSRYFKDMVMIQDTAFSLPSIEI